MVRLPARERALVPFRAEIDAIDAAMVDLLARRFDVVKRVIEVKRAEGLAALLPQRVEDVVAKVSTAAGEKGVPPDLAEKVWRVMIDWIVAYENAELNGS
jgi:isochorismate pyruvate lyase